MLGAGLASVFSRTAEDVSIEEDRYYEHKERLHEKGLHAEREQREPQPTGRATELLAELGDWRGSAGREGRAPSQERDPLLDLTSGVETFRGRMSHVGRCCAGDDSDRRHRRKRDKRAKQEKKKSKRRKAGRGERSESSSRSLSPAPSRAQRRARVSDQAPANSSPELKKQCEQQCGHNMQNYREPRGLDGRGKHLAERALHDRRSHSRSLSRSRCDLRQVGHRKARHTQSDTHDSSNDEDNYLERSKRRREQLRREERVPYIYGPQEDANPIIDFIIKSHK